VLALVPIDPVGADERCAPPAEADLDAIGRRQSYSRAPEEAREGIAADGTPRCTEGGTRSDLGSRRCLDPAPPHGLGDLAVT
jgi:hypothetical protein